MKRLIVIVCALLMGAGLVAPGQAFAATPGRIPPKPPTAVTVTAGKAPAQAVLAWAPPADRGSAPVFGYSIVRNSTEGSRVYWNKGKRDTTATYTRTFSGLTAGVTYRFRIWTWTRAGKSDPVDVFFTPPPAPPAVYAVDATTDDVVRIPTGGGAPVVVAGGVTADNLITDAAGSLFFTDGMTNSVKKVAAGATSAITVAAGVGGTIGVDAAGNVYGARGADLVRVSPAGATAVVYTAPRPFTYLAVAPDGTVTIEYPDVRPDDAPTTSSTFITVPPTGSPVVRVIDCNSICLGDVTADGTGAIYVWTVATGASGSSFWRRIAPGATEVNLDEPSLAGYPGRAVGALGPSDVFYVLPTTLACYGSPSGDPNVPPCVADPSVTRVGRYNPDTTRAPDLPVSGFSLPDATGLTLHQQGADVDVSASGAIYLATADGLVAFSATGGPATVLASGDFTRVAAAN